MHLWPDFGRLEVVKRWENWSSIGAIVFVALMVVCESTAHWLGSRKDELTSGPWALSTRQKQQLHSALRSEVPARVGLCSTRAREHQVLLDQLARIFADAGWEAPSKFIGFPNESLESGILFLSYAGNTPESNPDFSGLERAFRAADIEFRRVRLPLQGAYTNGISTSDPVIVIGNRFDY
jgi:hypothetical protein